MENEHLYRKGGGSVRVRHDRGAFGDGLKLAEPMPGTRPCNPLEVFPKADSDEGVEEGVEAGVGVRQALGNVFGQL